MQYLSVAIGGALGAMARFFLIQITTSKDFPWVILFINIFGSLLIGILFVIIIEKSYLSESLRLLLMVGLLGAFTTFSTFSLDNWELLIAGEFIKAALNIVLNVTISLLAVWVGVVITRYFV